MRWRETKAAFNTNSEILTSKIDIILRKRYGSDAWARLKRDQEKIEAF